MNLLYLQRRYDYDNSLTRMNEFEVHIILMGE